MAIEIKLGVIKLKEILSVQYNIEIVDIKKTKGGFAAEAYIVSTKDKKYFLKAYDKLRPNTNRNVSIVNVYTPFLCEIAKSELKNKVPTPIFTKDSKYFCEDENYIYLLYDYLNAKTVAEDKLSKEEHAMLGEIIAKLHKFSMPYDNIPTSIVEDFELWCNNNLREFVCAKVKNEVHGYVEEYIDVLKNLTDMIDEYKIKAKNENAEFVFCHTDVHNWNLMREQNNLILIDWEGLKFAPKEADFFSFQDLEYKQEFESSYKKHRPNLKINKTILKFYNLRRVCEDAWEYIEKLLCESLNDKEKQETIEALLEQCGYAKYETERL